MSRPAAGAAAERAGGSGRRARRRRQGAGEALGLGVAAALTLLYALVLRSDSGVLRPAARWLRVFELKTLDVRMALRGSRPPSGQVVIVEIDEKSIAALGRYPWDRRVHARLIDRLAAAGARAIGLDILLADPSDAADDGALADAMARAGNVYLAAHLVETASARPHHDVPDFSYRRFINPSAAPAAGRALKGRHVQPPVPVLARAAAGIGLSELGAADPDQVFRWLPLAVEADEPGRYYPPFALVVALGARGGQVGRDAVLDFGTGVRTVQLGLIPTDPSGHLLVNFLGGPRTFPHLSYVDVLEGRFDPGAVRGRIVLVGATAKGVSDLRSTPLAVLPGVEVHATVIDNLLAGDYVRLPGWERLTSVLLMGLLLSLTLPRLDARLGIAVAVLIVGGYLGLVQVAFVVQARWLHLFYPLTGALVVAAVQISYGYLTQERQKLAIRRTFQKFVPPEVVEQLLRDPDQVRLGGERRVITVFFSDIRGFTSLSENIQPEEVVRFLNGYFAVMTPIIYRHGGIVDKFEGDAIMALFGAPIAHPDHALRAVRAALEMQQALAEVRRQSPLPGLGPMRMGVGIATGEVVVGNIGSPDRLNYTAVGDTVNLAARLQDLNKEFGSQILISQATYEAARAHIEAVAIPDVRVRGRTRTETVYRVLGARAAGEAPGAADSAPSSTTASASGVPQGC